MSSPRKALRRISACLCAALIALGAGISQSLAPAEAADRPFPDYTLTYEWIHGEVDPNWKQGDPGDGCIRSDAHEVTHLYTFGFGSTINPCDGVRTTMTFKYNTVNPDMDPTREFRWGTTWQYKERDKNGPWIWKPIENLKLDDSPVDPNFYDTSNQDNVVVKKADGTWRHVGDRDSNYFEPVHVVFDDEFYNNESHTFVWDSYLPADADEGGLSIGTGSTGDSQGGSIGAKANGLSVVIPAYVVYHYVLDSEYRAAQEISDPSTKLPNRTLAGWGGPLEGSTYTTIQCLESEGQQLAPAMSKQATTEIYPELAEFPSIEGEVRFQDRAGALALASYPYEFYVGQPGNWASLSGMRRMNYNDDTGKFENFGDKNVPYKPTFESVKLEIPGYTYVDNDLPILKDGKMTMPDYKDEEAPNLKLTYHKTPGVETQHIYFTYKVNPGTFELSKKNQAGEGLEGAKFELYQLASDTKSPCGAAPEDADVKEVKVCDVRTPTTDTELRDMLANEPTNCTTKRLRKVVLDGFNADGTFTTNVHGVFSPSGAPALTPGQYYVREVKAPGDYKILNEYTPFEVEPQSEPVRLEDGKTVSTWVSRVDVTNYVEPPQPTPTPSTSVPVPTPSTSVPVPTPSTSVPVPTPSTSVPVPTPSTPVPVPTPSTPAPVTSTPPKSPGVLAVTGAQTLGIAVLAVALLGAGSILLLWRRQREK